MRAEAGILHIPPTAELIACPGISAIDEHAAAGIPRNPWTLAPHTEASTCPGISQIDLIAAAGRLNIPPMVELMHAAGISPQTALTNAEGIPQQAPTPEASITPGVLQRAPVAAESTSTGNAQQAPAIAAGIPHKAPETSAHIPPIELKQFVGAMHMAATVWKGEVHTSVKREMGFARHKPIASAGSLQIPPNTLVTK